MTDTDDLIKQITMYVSMIPYEDKKYVLGYGQGVVSKIEREKRRVELEDARRLLTENGHLVILKGDD